MLFSVSSLLPSASENDLKQESLIEILKKRLSILQNKLSKTSDDSQKRHLIFKSSLFHSTLLCLKWALMQTFTCKRLGAIIKLRDVKEKMLTSKPLLCSYDGFTLLALAPGP